MLPRGALVTCYPGAHVSHVTPCALLCFDLLSFADDDDGDDDLMIMILTIVRIVSIDSTLSIVTIISMSPIRLCLRGPREPSEALGRPRGLLAFALLCLALICLPLL